MGKLLNKIKYLIYVVIAILMIYCFYGEIEKSVYADEIINSKIIYEIYNDNSYEKYENNIDFIQHSITGLNITIFFEINTDVADYLLNNPYLGNDLADLSAHRMHVEEYIITNCNNAIDSDLDLVYSNYAPYAFYTFTDIYDYTNNYEKIENAALDIDVKSVHIVQSKISSNSSYAEDLTSDRYEFDDALRDIGLENLDFDGSGINVGIWEADVKKTTDFINYQTYYGYLDSSLNSFSNRNIIYNDRNQNLPTPFSDHASVVGIISVSNNGIACNSNIYSSNIDNFVADLDWFVSNDVVLINCSFSLYVTTNTYTYLDSLIDYYALYYGIIFCVAAGNKSAGASMPGLVTSPGTALNVVTVGSTNYEKKISNTSSTISFNGTKPTVVAPGSRIYNISNDCPNTDGIIGAPEPTNSGTSVATPFVTGIIALLLEEFQSLAGYPERIISILTASTIKLPTQTGVWDNEAGAGFVNYQHARIIATSYSQSFYVDGAQQSDTIVQTIPIVLLPYSQVKVMTAWTADSNTFVNPLYPFYTAPIILRKYDLELRDANTNNLLTDISSSNWNVQYLEYLNDTGLSINATIIVKLKQNRLSSDTIDLGCTSYYFQNYIASFDCYNHYLTSENYVISEQHSLSFVNDFVACPCLYCGLGVDVVDTYVVDNFVLSESNSSIINIYSDNVFENALERVILKQSSRIKIEYEYTGNQLNNIYCILSKIIYELDTHQYFFIPIYEGTVNSVDNYLTTTFDLVPDTYYLGFFGMNEGINFNINITRLVTQSGSNAFIVDPGSNWNCGSQINILEKNFLNKSYNGTSITEGFTRIIYLNESVVPSPSRLDYYWYSSDETKAIVTTYGTILGKNAGLVKIMAVSKLDSSKVFVMQFTIYEDDGTGITPLETNLVIEYSETDNGTFHLMLNDVICPYPWYQYYSWDVDNLSSGLIVVNDYWGNYTVNGTGMFDIIGTDYIFNTIFITIIIIIHVTIIQNT